MFDNAPLPHGRQSIAVIGAGIAGLGAAWCLARQHDVTLYEANHYLGGHSNTVDVTAGGATFPVDTGFIVYNEKNYPNLTRLFAELAVPTQPSDMSFSVSIDGGRLEYAGAAKLRGLFAQRRNLANPGFWRMIRDILRFNGELGGAAHDPALEAVTLGEMLQARGYSRAFTERHLLPMAAAIWSGSMKSMLDFPAASFIRFFHNHGLLQVSGRPQWRTVTGGSRQYVRRIAKSFDGKVRLNAPVAAIVRGTDGVSVTTRADETHRYDHVVIAAHGDQALRMLADPTPLERDVLSGFSYQPNRAVLHRDVRLMPRRKAAWASWNYLAQTGDDANAPAAVTYWMNRLQSLHGRPDVFVSLNPTVEPREDLVEREFWYDHPQFDRSALEAQRRLPAVQGIKRTWFCGSYHGHGFHEDAFSAGLSVAAALGAPAPWFGLPEPMLPRRDAGIAAAA